MQVSVGAFLCVQRIIRQQEKQKFDRKNKKPLEIRKI